MTTQSAAPDVAQALADVGMPAFEREMRARGCPSHWTFESDGCGGYNNEATAMAFIAWLAGWELSAEREAARAPAVRPEPIRVEAVAEVAIYRYGEPTLDWLVEGGISSLPENTLLLIAHKPITDDDGIGGEVCTLQTLILGT